MNESQQSQYRKRLCGILDDIARQDDLGSNAQETVKLDQQSVGRLSRMDALQQQAMAKATGQRRNVQKQRALAALARMDDGEFGFCTDCGESIPEARLDLDPTVPKCISCANG